MGYEEPARIISGWPESSSQEPEREGERSIRHSGYRRPPGVRAFLHPRLAAPWWMR